MLSMERFRQQDLQAGRKVTRLWVALWIVLLFGVPESVPAQALQTIRLTLRDAVQLALQHAGSDREPELGAKRRVP